MFNTALAAAYPQLIPPGGEAVASVGLHSDGRYAFVEFVSPELATVSLTLNGQVR